MDQQPDDEHGNKQEENSISESFVIVPEPAENAAGADTVKPEKEPVPTIREGATVQLGKFHNKINMHGYKEVQKIFVTYYHVY